MTNQEALEIANAAIEMIESRLKAGELRQKRRDVLQDAECATPYEDYGDCFRGPFGDAVWCERCKKAQAAHLEYKQEVKRRAGSLIKLRRLVVRRNRDES